MGTALWAAIRNVYSDTARQVIERGRAHPYVGKVFRERLTAIREEILARDPGAIPGATEQPLLLLLVCADAGAGRGGARGRGQRGVRRRDVATGNAEG